MSAGARVSVRASVRLAWSLWAFCALMALLMASLGAANFAISEPGSALDALSVIVPMLAYPTVGALVISRRGNHIGWVFCATGVALALTWAGGNYANYALLERPDSVPGGVASELISNIAQLPAFCLLGAVLLLFPDGRLRSRRWRLVPRALLAAGLLGALAYGAIDGPFDSPFESFRNPIGISGSRDPLDGVTSLAWLTCLVGLLAAAISLLGRLRAARGVERLQLKWVVFAGSLLAAVFVIGFPTFFVSVSDTVERLRGAAFTLVSAGIPVAAGIAILRHRLYDIDVVINRTLVYGLLTATLAGTYLAMVLLLQLALRPLTSQSNLAIAGSTLAVAALFRPARSRIQAAVDRRFYRRKYDAARTLEGFSARLREQVDLDALGGELRSVVSETMQPAHVSVWLREGPR